VPARHTQPGLTAQAKNILPLYLAGYGVVVCSLAAFVSTDGEGGFPVRNLLVVAVGLLVSIAARLRRCRQNSVFGLVAGLLVLSYFWLTVSDRSHWSGFVSDVTSGRGTGPGLILAWFLVIYSFAMVSDEVIVFSIVPSMALMGLMASENLNPEVVVYFVGMVFSAVFLLVYESMLSRGLIRFGRETPESRLRVTSLGTPTLLSATVLAIAIVMGAGGSLPLRMAGDRFGRNAASLSIPSPPALIQEAEKRYINQVELSGVPPRLSDSVVMHVTVEGRPGGVAPLYWRQKVFSDYTGSSWTAHTGYGSVSAEEAEFGRLRFHLQPLAEGPTGEAVERMPLRQSFRIRGHLLGDTLPVAGEPEYIELPFGVPGRLPGRRFPRGDFAARALRQDNYRSVSTPFTGIGRRYNALSLIPEASARQLRRAGDRFPASVKVRNTALDDFEPGVREARRAIARRVTFGQRTQYDKVMALTRWLQREFTYSLTPPRTPPDRDAVLFFLTESRQGYCEIFASSLAVLCRELGIPARLATGYATGEVDPEGDYRALFHFPGVTRDQLTTYAVRERDLHAWTEVYFPGYGWIPFDPTASRTLDSTFWASLKASFGEMLGRLVGRGSGPMAVLAALGFIAAFLAKTYVLDPLRQSLWWRLLVARTGKRRYSAEHWDLLFARSAARFARRAGRKGAGETALEYAARIRAHVAPEAATAFQRIAELYTRFAFRKEPPDTAEFEALEDADRELRGLLKRRRPVAEPEPA
jgi:hypothetical protein